MQRKTHSTKMHFLIFNNTPKTFQILKSIFPLLFKSKVFSKYRIVSNTIALLSKNLKEHSSELQSFSKQAKTLFKLNKTVAYNLYCVEILQN